MSDPVREFFIDQRIESYDKYVPDEWTAGFFKGVPEKSVLDQLLIDFVLAWRTTAYIAAMPATMVKMVQASTLGYAGHVSPDSSIMAFADGVLLKLSQKIPELCDHRELKSRLVTELVSLADDFRAARANVKPEMPIEPLWQDFLTQDAFYMTVSASQRVSYVAFYNAYEAFLVDCTKQAMGVDQLRATDSKFMEGLRSAFGADLTGPCWGRKEIQIGREVRHALSHAGGRETEKLKKLKHGITLRGAVLQIVPGDNHKLLQGLRTAVDALVLVAAALPQFK